MDRKRILRDVSVIKRFNTESDHRIVRGILNINLKLENNRLRSHLHSTVPQAGYVQFQLEIQNRCNRVIRKVIYRSPNFQVRLLGRCDIDRKCQTESCQIPSLSTKRSVAWFAVIFEAGIPVPYMKLLRKIGVLYRDGLHQETGQDSSDKTSLDKRPRMAKPSHQFRRYWLKLNASTEICSHAPKPPIDANDPRALLTHHSLVVLEVFFFNLKPKK